MDLVIQVAQNVFSPLTLLICFLGTLIGVILGAIPGMNGGIGIAVMLPFTYSMHPAQGLLFLGVVFAKLEMPTTPVVLGLILGSLIESNFVRTQTIVTSQGANFFVYVLTRPLCIGILCLTAYLIYSNVRAMRRGRQIQQGTNIKQDLRDDA